MDYITQMEISLSTFVEGVSYYNIFMVNIPYNQ